MRKHSAITFFEDFAEQQHVFELIDKWADLPDDHELPELCGSRSFFLKQINTILERVHENERRHCIEVGSSHQSELLCKLRFLLTCECRNAAGLRANATEVKELLSLIQSFSYEPFIKKAEKFTATRKNRKNKLNQIAERILKDKGLDLSARKVWNLLPEYFQKYIDHIDETIVEWVSEKGKKNSTSFHTFESNLSKIRNKLKNNNS